MNEISNVFELKFMKECSFEEERQKYFDALEVIREERERNVSHVIPYKKVESPKVAYILETDKEIYPIYTESDSYGKAHVWVEDGVYNAGVEIENRYLDLDDKLRPKIRIYDEIPDCIVEKIIKGIVNENKI